MDYQHGRLLIMQIGLPSSSLVCGISRRVIAESESGGADKMPMTGLMGVDWEARRVLRMERARPANLLTVAAVRGEVEGSVLGMFTSTKEAESAANKLCLGLVSCDVSFGGELGKTRGLPFNRYRSYCCAMSAANSRATGSVLASRCLSRSLMSSKVKRPDV